MLGQPRRGPPMAPWALLSGFPGNKHQSRGSTLMPSGRSGAGPPRAPVLTSDPWALVQSGSLAVSGGSSRQWSAKGPWALERLTSAAMGQNSLWLMEELPWVGAQQCRAGAGLGAVLLGGLLLHAASHFTPTVTCMGTLRARVGTGHCLPSWQSLPGGSGLREHGFQMLPPDSGHTAFCVSLVEAIAGHHL